MKTQKKTILDYRVILKPDIRIGSKKSCYVAFCPTLGIVDDGDSPQKALNNIKSTISFHLKCLQKEQKEIPVDNPNEEMVTNAQVSFSLTPLTRFAI